MAGLSFPPLYPILDAELVLRDLPPGNPAARSERLGFVVREMAAAGVEILQYRNKRDPDSIVIDDARAIREAAGSMHLILNDRVSLFASRCGFSGWHGLHVGQDDLAPREARRILDAGLGPTAILGFSTHSDAQVAAADRQPVDYIAIGPVFSTSTKSDPSPVIGLDGVRHARALTRKPLVAIGGITLATAASVYAAGADSLAVISGIFGAPSPAQSVRDFLAIFK